MFAQGYTNCKRRNRKSGKYRIDIRNDFLSLLDDFSLDLKNDNSTCNRRNLRGDFIEDCINIETDSYPKPNSNQLFANFIPKDKASAEKEAKLPVPLLDLLNLSEQKQPLQQAQKQIKKSPFYNQRYSFSEGERNRKENKFDKVMKIRTHLSEALEMDENFTFIELDKAEELFQRREEFLLDCLQKASQFQLIICIKRKAIALQALIKDCEEHNLKIFFSESFPKRIAIDFSRVENQSNTYNAVSEESAMYLLYTLKDEGVLVQDAENEILMEYIKIIV